MNKLNFTLPLPPSANNYMDKKVERSGKRFVVKFYPSEEYVEFNHVATKIIKEYMKDKYWEVPPKGIYLKLETTIYFNQLGRDADNELKPMIDTIKKTGLVFIDDAWVLPAVKNVYVDKDNPRVEVEIYVMDKIGVFRDEQEMLEFEECNCKNCKKNKEHCPVYKGFLQNRVHDIQLDDMTCKRIKEYNK